MPKLHLMHDAPPDLGFEATGKLFIVQGNGKANVNFKLTLLAAAQNPVKAMASFKSYTAGRIVRRLRECQSPILKLLAFHKARHKVDREHSGTRTMRFLSSPHPTALMGGETEMCGAFSVPALVV